MLSITIDHDSVLVIRVQVFVVDNCVVLSLVICDGLTNVYVSLESHFANQVDESLNLVVRLCADSKYGLLQLLLEHLSQVTVLFWVDLEDA